MKVSIITITRNNLAGLKKTVTSVRAQRVGDVDGSGRRRPEMLPIAPRCRILK